MATRRREHFGAMASNRPVTTASSGGSLCCSLRAALSGPLYTRNWCRTVFIPACADHVGIGAARTPAQAHRSQLLAIYRLDRMLRAASQPLVRSGVSRPGPRTYMEIALRIVRTKSLD